MRCRAPGKLCRRGQARSFRWGFLCATTPGCPAPTDTDSPEIALASGTDNYVVLYHPGYRKGVDPVEFPYTKKIGMKPARIDDPQFQLSDSKLQISPDDNYLDPVSSVAKEYAGRWIAGFAPVGNTGFVVVVQQRFADAVSLESSTLWNLALWSALASLVAVAILVMALRRWSRSRRSESGMIYGND